MRVMAPTPSEDRCWVAMTTLHNLAVLSILLCGRPLPHPRKTGHVCKGQGRGRRKPFCLHCICVRLSILAWEWARSALLGGWQIHVDTSVDVPWVQCGGCKTVLLVQGVGLSSFLETNTGLGQRTLSAFLQLDTSDAAMTRQGEADLQGWKQTFLDAQTRQEVAK